MCQVKTFEVEIDARNLSSDTFHMRSDAESPKVARVSVSESRKRFLEGAI
jgi:hypothetical protein